MAARCSIDAHNKNTNIGPRHIRKKVRLHGKDVLQDVICLQKLPFGLCCRWRVRVSKCMARQGLDLGRDRKELAQLSLPRRYDCTATGQHDKNYIEMTRKNRAFERDYTHLQSLRFD